MKYGFLTAFAETMLLVICLALAGTCVVLGRIISSERAHSNELLAQEQECASEKTWWQARLYQLNLDTLDGGI